MKQKNQKIKRLPRKLKKYLKNTSLAFYLSHSKIGKKLIKETIDHYNGKDWPLLHFTKV